MTEWIKGNAANNFVLREEGVDFTVSYCPFTPNFMNMGAGEEETALVMPDNKYYILNGDFRKEYQELFPDKEKCLAFFAEHEDDESEWSN